MIPMPISDGWWIPYLRRFHQCLSSIDSWIQFAFAIWREDEKLVGINVIRVVTHEILLREICNAIELLSSQSSRHFDDFNIYVYLCSFANVLLNDCGLGRNAKLKVKTSWSTYGGTSGTIGYHLTFEIIIDTHDVSPSRVNEINCMIFLFTNCIE